MKALSDISLHSAPTNILNSCVTARHTSVNVKKLLPWYKCLHDGMKLKINYMNLKHSENWENIRKLALGI
jgi:hypothetical protein